MKTKIIVAASMAVAYAVTAQAFAALPLDEGEWPAVVPEFTPGPSARERRNAPEPACAEQRPRQARPSWETGGFADPPHADVRMVAGAPQFHLDGKPFFALWGGVSQNKRPDRRPRHSSAPLSIVTVYSYTTRGSSCHEWWPSENGFDPAIFDRQAEMYGRENPYFMWDLVLYPPKDWQNAHPDDICMDDEGKPLRDGPGPFSFASSSALDAMERAMSKAIRYLESAPYANRIIGYRINSGHATEWAGWIAPAGRFTDFSPVAQRGFAEYAKKHHPELGDAHVPSAAERKSSDPAARARCAAFYDFYSRRSADNVIRLMRTARKIVGSGKLLGTYMGYIMYSRDNTTQMRAYYALKHLMESRAVDFLMSPQPYTVRRIGDTCGDMKPFATLAANGVVPIIENDVHTSNGPYNGNQSQVHTLAQSIGLIRRDAGIALCRREPVFFYALCEGTEFDFPEFATDMAAVRKVAEHCLAVGAGRHAEVAYVMSEEMLKAAPLPDDRDCRSAGVSRQSYNRNGSVRRSDVMYVACVSDVFRLNYTTLARAGAPVD